jgi:hypothetical protein
MALRKGFFLGILAFSPAAQSRRRIVLALTATPASDISDAISFDDSRRFLRAARTIILSSVGVVTFFLWPRERSLIVLKFKNFMQTF